MKLLSVSSAIRMVLEGGVGSAPTLHSSGNLRGLHFCPSALWSVSLLSFPGCPLLSFPPLFCWWIPAGGTKVNVVPLPTSEVTDMLPPRRSMMVLQIEVQSGAWAKLFTLTKRSNTRSTLSGAMPIPVSVTWNATYLPSRRYP